jgi:hypothetical protein
MADPEQYVNLSQEGGVAVVVLAHAFKVPDEYAYHPQLVSLPVADLPTDWGELSNAIPSTTKIVLVAGELPADNYRSLRTVLQRRSLNYIVRRNTFALRDALVKVLPERKAPVPDADADKAPPKANGAAVDAEAPPPPPVNEVKGRVSAFVAQHADLTKGSAEEARRLMRVAVGLGVKTTVASLAQAVSNLKRKRQASETPRSLMSAQQKALVTLDEAIGHMTDSIAALQLIREYVEQTETLNLGLQKKLAKFKSMLDEA